MHPPPPRPSGSNQTNTYIATDTAIRSAFLNPYANQYPTIHSSHYAQAYAQYNANPTTPQGYTISSTYRRGPNMNRGGLNSSRESSRMMKPPHPTQHQTSQHGSWYQAGNHRCSYTGCSFTGSDKSVEVHMMDRHLVYPPDWDKRKQGSGWDADPSLKGKKIPIQGTGIVLDTPEALETWIADRKKRFPTASQVEDKKRKMDDAIARGQLTPADIGLWNKRQKVDNGRHNNHERKQGRAGARNLLNRPQMRVRGSPGICRAGMANQRISHQTPSSPSELSSSGSDSEPELISSKIAPPDQVPTAEQFVPDIKQTLNPTPKPSVKLRVPKSPVRSGFGPKSSLLRNLILPEIRMTASNVSQAIRFIVDNQFLENVEIRPGQAASKKIQIIDSIPEE